jgi:hypothetical protein
MSLALKFLTVKKHGSVGMPYTSNCNMDMTVTVNVYMYILIYIPDSYDATYKGYSLACAKTAQDRATFGGKKV